MRSSKVRKMGEVTTYRSPLQPDKIIAVALFGNVSNCAELKKMAMAGEIEAALLKTNMITDPFQVLVAAAKASHAHANDKKVTRALYSEVIYNLSASKNITDSFKKFGVADDDSCILVVRITDNEEQAKLADLQDQVSGQLMNLDHLSQFTDESLIKKVYKIKDQELTVGSLLEAVVGRIASKDFVSL